MRSSFMDQLQNLKQDLQSLKAIIKDVKSKRINTGGEIDPFHWQNYFLKSKVSFRERKKIKKELLSNKKKIYPRVTTESNKFLIQLTTQTFPKNVLMKIPVIFVRGTAKRKRSPKESAKHIIRETPANKY